MWALISIMLLVLFFDIYYSHNYFPFIEHPVISLKELLNSNIYGFSGIVSRLVEFFMIFNFVITLILTIKLIKIDSNLRLWINIVFGTRMLQALISIIFLMIVLKQPNLGLGAVPIGINLIINIIAFIAYTILWKVFSTYLKKAQEQKLMNFS